MRCEILFEHKDKFIIKYESGDIAHMLKNKLVSNVQIGQKIEIAADIEKKLLDGREVNVHTPTTIPNILSIAEKNNFQDAKKTSAERFAEIEEKLTADLKKNGKSNLFKLAKVLASQDPNVKSKLDQITGFANTEREEKYKKTKNPENTHIKFLISTDRLSKFPIGDDIFYDDYLVTIKNSGKPFHYKHGAGNKNKADFKEDEEVCYIYVERKHPNADEFITSIKKYYKLVEFMRSNGIKPRSLSNQEVETVQNGSIYCDTRPKVDGNSWFVVTHNYVWYLNQKPIANDPNYNIKVNQTPTHGWRVSLAEFSDKLEDLIRADALVFKSNIIPLS